MALKRFFARSNLREALQAGMLRRLDLENVRLR
jgi:hypothetical protein